MITQLVLTKSDITSENDNTDWHIQSVMEKSMDNSIRNSKYTSAHIHVHSRLQFNHGMFTDITLMSIAFERIFETFKNNF